MGGRTPAYTFAVQKLPPDVNVPGASIGNKSIQSAASAGCEAAFSRFIGGDPARRALSRLSVTYFLPPQKYYDRGADWVRCDVVALQSADALAPLPQPLQGFLDDSRALQDYGVCSAGQPGATTSALVICGQPHTFRALTALRLGTTTSRYPGKAVVGTRGAEALLHLYRQRPRHQQRLHLRLDLPDRVRLGVRPALRVLLEQDHPLTAACAAVRAWLRSRACGAASGRAASPWRS